MAKRDFVTKLMGLLVFIMATLALRIWVLEPLTINQQMANQIVQEKDLVIVMKQDSLQHGDLVAYRIDGKKYAGRVIGVAGDRIAYMDDVLYRNGVTVQEQYIIHSGQADYITQDMSVQSLTNTAVDTLPKETYLILNDNRIDTQDSRNSI